VLKFHALEIAPLYAARTRASFDAAFPLQSGDAIGGQQQRALFRFPRDVVEIEMKGKRAIVRNRPGRGRPDDRADIVSNFRGIPFAAAHDAKLTQSMGSCDSSYSTSASASAVLSNRHQ